MVTFLHDGPKRPWATVLMAHGAGAPMDSPFMEAFAELLAGRGMAVARFEFAYMAARRTGGGKRPPPRAERLTEEYIGAIEALGAARGLVIGGKSFGGRVASLCVQELGGKGPVAGLLCLGFPFHPPGRPERLRTAALLHLEVPALICQGTRDPFGAKGEVESYGLPPSVQVHWAEDGNHDLVPRKASGLTAMDNWREAADAILTWTRGLG